MVEAAVEEAEAAIEEDGAEVLTIGMLRDLLVAALRAEAARRHGLGYSGVGGL